LNHLEDVSHDKNCHYLIAKAAEEGLEKLSPYYDRASPIIMAAPYVDPRCKLAYFYENGWSVGGDISNSFNGTQEDLIEKRVKPL